MSPAAIETTQTPAHSNSTLMAPEFGLTRIRSRGCHHRRRESAREPISGDKPALMLVDDPMVTNGLSHLSPEEAIKGERDSVPIGSDSDDYS